MGFLRLFLAVIGLALAGAGVGVAIFWWTARPPLASRDPIALDVGNASFLVPPAYVRGGALPRAGSQERMDLVLAFPGMAPVDAGTTGTRVFLAILREDGVLDPAERVNEIYGLFLEPDIWQNPGGLLLRRFAADSPYGDEELFISPPDGRAFAARCRKPAPRDAPFRDGQLRPADIGETCLWRFRIGGADAQVRFPPELLPQWQELAEGVRARIGGWRVK
jgi:hypothetical protein